MKNEKNYLSFNLEGINGAIFSPRYLSIVEKDMKYTLVIIKNQIHYAIISKEMESRVSALGGFVLSRESVADTLTVHLNQPLSSEVKNYIPKFWGLGTSEIINKKATLFIPFSKKGLISTASSLICQEIKSLVYQAGFKTANLKIKSIPKDLKNVSVKDGIVFNEEGIIATI